MITNLRIGKKLLTFDSPKIMGILNITPDSFYQNSRISSAESAILNVRKMISEGADIIDIGGYSSRPGASQVEEQEELSRVIPIIQTLRLNFPELIISCDTFRGNVAHAALCEGANLINDISAGEFDDSLFKVIAKHQCPYVLMHSKGTFQTMHLETNYSNLFSEIAFFLSKKIKKLHELGVTDIVIDPGFGFSKTIEQNYTLLEQLTYFKIFNAPILVGISRKSMIYKKLEVLPEDALNGTTILNTKAILNGASILRVHDVKEAKQIITLLKN
jgi:dihydropteroate synthase